MRIVPIPFILLALTACDGGEATIPVDHGTGFRDGYVVQVQRSGTIEWNGQKLDDAEFVRYVRQYAAMPVGAGRLWIEFAPDAPSGRIAFVRQYVLESGLCKQRRCVEGSWGARRPVVNYGISGAGDHLLPLDLWASQSNSRLSANNAPPQFAHD